MVKCNSISLHLIRFICNALLQNVACVVLKMNSMKYEKILIDILLKQINEEMKNTYFIENYTV